MRAEGEGEEEKELLLEEAAPLPLEGQEAAEAAEVIEAARRAFASFPPPAGSLAATKAALLIACADGGILRVTRVKPAGRKAMDAGAWANGLGGKRVAAVAVGGEKVKKEESR